jgi:hypothetical protein
MFGFQKLKCGWLPIQKSDFVLPQNHQRGTFQRCSPTVVILQIETRPWPNPDPRLQAETRPGPDSISQTRTSLAKQYYLYFLEVEFSIIHFISTYNMKKILITLCWYPMMLDIGFCTALLILNHNPTWTSRSKLEEHELTQQISIIHVLILKFHEFDFFKFYHIMLLIY